MLLIFGTDLSKLGAYSKSVRKNALLEVSGKGRHFQIRLLLWEMQVIRYFLCMRDIGEKPLNRLLLVLKRSHQRCSVKKSALKNFANCTEKHMCWSLFLIDLQAWGPSTFLEKTPAQVFFEWNFRNSFGKSICKPLLLYIHR